MRTKKKWQILIYINTNNNNKQSKKKRKTQCNMAETMYVRNNIDVEIQKNESKLRKKLAETIKNEASQRYELLMIKTKEQWIELQAQAAFR